MNLKSLTVALTFAIISAPAFAGEQKVTLSVPGMTCASCPYIVQAAIAKVEGVTEVEADYSTLTATVVFDDEVTTLDDITFATMMSGYESFLKTDDTNS